MEERAATAQPVKPSLRGIPDVIGLLVALPATFALVNNARVGAAQLGAAIYGPALVFLLGVSAFYHVPTWKPVARRWLRRLDHAGIFLLIAGTYTPICLVAMPPGAGAALLGWVWSIAGIGILIALLWPAAPRLVNVGLAIGLGWLIVMYADQVFVQLTTTELVLILSGGLMYSMGAIAYALRWPNPFPRVYGYHEVFHTGVVAAAVCHFLAMWTIVS